MTHAEARTKAVYLGTLEREYSAAVKRRNREYHAGNANLAHYDSECAYLAQLIRELALKLDQSGFTRRGDRKSPDLLSRFGMWLHLKTGIEIRAII